MRTVKATVVTFGFQKKVLLAAACLLSMPASANVVTDTFTGVVAANDAYGFATTLDNSAYCTGGHCFGGGNLIGDPFTLTVTMNVASSTSYGQITGGAFYGGTNPITMTLSINGVSLAINSTTATTYNNGNTSSLGNSSFGEYRNAGSGNVEFGAQSFVWSPQNQGEQLLSLSFDVFAAGSSAFGTLGSVNGSNRCSVNQGAAPCLNGTATEFSAFDNELLALDITGVNAATTPLPAALPLFASGLVGLVLLGWRRKRKVAALSA